MKTGNLIRIIHRTVCAILLLSSVSVYAQSNSGSFSNNRDLGFQRLDINEIISTAYLRDSSYVYTIQDEDSEQWELQEKAIYHYNNQGRELLRNILTLSESGWSNKRQVRSNYMSDFLATRETLLWSEATSNWEFDAKSDFTYNYVGLIEEISNFTFTNSSWTAFNKISYTYNSNYNISEEATFDWDEELNIWIPESRFLYSYNSNEKIKKEVYQIWDDSLMIWVNTTSQIFDYNDSHKLVSTIRRNWDSEGAEWLNTSIVIIEYNEKGQIKASQQEAINQYQEYTPTQFEEANYDSDGNIGQVIRSEWDANTESWSIYQKQVHFWAEYQHGNLDNNQNEIDCFFANPYTIGLPLYCESLKPDVLYTVRVYDLQGRFFYSGQFLGSSSFRIRDYLEPGYYIFQITGGLDSHSEKIFIKN